MPARQVWLLSFEHLGRTGRGEAAPIDRLSPESIAEVPDKLKEIQERLAGAEAPHNEEACFDLAAKMARDFPSIRMGLETCFLDWLHGGKGVVFRNDFVEGQKNIPINGLIWMAAKEDMIRQIEEKLEKGFNCIKLKIGALDFSEELKVLEYLRKKAPDVILRLDANGAFETHKVLRQMQQLAAYNVHSIEQPIAPKQEQAMRLLVDKQIIPIALDEELIGIQGPARDVLLDTIKPDYIVLKPSLLGGFFETADWIQCAESRGIKWWITSYLESNLGLSAIAQFTAAYELDLHQGLGTGGLFSNNLESSLIVEEGYLKHPL
jgi:o-succinylbenzoate synthase